MNIYSDIRSCQFFIQIYSDIRPCNFFDTNIFVYSFEARFSRMSHSGTEFTWALSSLQRTFQRCCGWSKWARCTFLCVPSSLRVQPRLLCWLQLCTRREVLGSSYMTLAEYQTLVLSGWILKSPSLCSHNDEPQTHNDMFYYDYWFKRNQTM